MNHASNIRSKSTVNLRGCLPVAALLASCAAALVSPSANADLTYSRYDSSTSFAAIVTDMPDFDQKWEGFTGSTGRAIEAPLPNDGNMYCGAAAAANVYAYIATHGYSSLITVPVLLEPTGNLWNDALISLWDKNLVGNIGSDIGVDAEDGTGPEAIEEFFRRALPSSDFSSDTNWNATFPEVGKELTDGNLVIVHRGRYRLNSSGKLARVNGHHVTAVGALAGSSSFLWVRNSNDVVDSTYQQSAFQTHGYKMTDKATAVTGGSYATVRWEMTPTDGGTDGGSAGDRLFLESYVVVRPKAGVVLRKP